MYIYLDMVAGFNCEMCGTCCRNDWLVTVDEASYQRNAKLFEDKGKSTEFHQAFIPLTGQNCLGEYAYISKGTNGGCWFLAEDNFCRLQREAGHQHLDKVCQTFPRYPMNTSRGQEVTLTFNCPAVLKRVTRLAPLVVIKSEEQPLIVESDSSAVHVFPSQQPAHNALRYYFELEQHFIDILQWRSLNMMHRLTFLQEIVDKIKRLEDKPEFLGQSLSRMFYENYEALDSKAPEAQISLEVTPEIIIEHFLVNALFQKNLYIYGLSRGTQLLQGFCQRIEQARKGAKNQDEDMKITQKTIMAMDFQHSHYPRRC